MKSRVNPNPLITYTYDNRGYLASFQTIHDVYPLTAPIIAYSHSFNNKTFNSKHKEKSKFHLIRR